MAARSSQRSVWGIALALAAAGGCNLVLDNEKRTLSSSAIETYDAGPTVVVVDSGTPSAVDAGSDAGACGDVEFPECTPGDIQMGMEACGGCGAGTRTRQRGCTIGCRWASFSAWTECQEPAEICKPGEPDGERMEACGQCMLGMRKSTRSCTSSCGWSDWMPQACIEDESSCTPGMIMRHADVKCGSMCGKASQTQTCNASCKWDPIVTGECISNAECAPGATRAVAAEGCNPAYCNKGIQQRIQICADSCTWAPPAPTGACTIPDGVCRPMDLGGTGSRCKPNDRGYRETCASSTSAPADACTWRGRQADPGC